MRFVLDTNILVRASITGTGPARELLQRIVSSSAHTLPLSPFLLDELERVLSYERLRAVTKLSSDEAAEYFRYLRSKQISEIVFPGLAPRVVPADPTDDAVVHTAVIGRADALCTLNRHFYHSDVVHYCRERGVIIASDVDMLHLLRSVND